MRLLDEMGGGEGGGKVFFTGEDMAVNIGHAVRAICQQADLSCIKREVWYELKFSLKPVDKSSGETASGR